MMAEIQALVKLPTAARPGLFQMLVARESLARSPSVGYHGKLSFSKTLIQRLGDVVW
jgi:hypothetical protein